MNKPKSRKSKPSHHDDFEFLNQTSTRKNLNGLQMSNSNPFQFRSDFKFKNVKQKEMYNAILNNRITFVTGCAGVGKTMVALMAALECLKHPEYNINQIFLTKPIVEIASSRSLGALPGTAEEKTSIYFAHFYDNLVKLIGQTATDFLKNSHMIKEMLLNYVRGLTFGSYDYDGNPIGTICIFDEAQNSTPAEMLTFISRMGEGSKMVIMGDMDQIDLKLNKGELSGLEDAMHRLVGIDQIGFVEFSVDDIVRDPFLIEIIRRYSKK